MYHVLSSFVSKGRHKGHHGQVYWTIIGHVSNAHLSRRLLLGLDSFLKQCKTTMCQNKRYIYLNEPDLFSL